MLGGSGACNEDIVKIDEDVGQAPQNPIHQPLERLGRVLEAKGHPQELEQAERGYDPRLLNITRRHWDLVTKSRTEKTVALDVD